MAGAADPLGAISNGVLSFAYSAGTAQTFGLATLTVNYGGGGTAANLAGFGEITGLARHV